VGQAGNWRLHHHLMFLTWRKLNLRLKTFLAGSAEFYQSQYDNISLIDLFLVFLALGTLETKNNEKNVKSEATWSVKTN
jgi:hypothetical protein